VPNNGAAPDGGREPVFIGAHRGARVQTRGAFDQGVESYSPLNTEARKNGTHADNITFDKKGLAKRIAEHSNVSLSVLDPFLTNLRLADIIAAVSLGCSASTPE
jgi:hypothetical protein